MISIHESLYFSVLYYQYYYYFGVKFTDFNLRGIAECMQCMHNTFCTVNVNVVYVSDLFTVVQTAKLWQLTLASNSSESIMHQDHEMLGVVYFNLDC
jgi:hypothetical protein